MNKQIADTMARHIADYTAAGVHAQRAQARCHERAMRLQPGTPERNTVDGGVAYNLNRKDKAHAARKAIIDMARETHLLTGDQIVAAIRAGKERANS